MELNELNELNSQNSQNSYNNQGTQGIKTLNIELDESSVEILKKVSNVHRKSLINIGLLLVSKTELYKSLTGDINNNLNLITNVNASLDNLGTLDNTNNQNNQNTQIVQNTQQAKPKATTSWDNF